MKFSIERLVEGGYLLITVSEDCEGNSMTEYHAFSSTSDVQSFVELLQTINSLYGPSTNKYSKERVHVDVVPGACYETNEIQEYLKDKI